jgi:hypothetical protein
MPEIRRSKYLTLIKEKLAYLPSVAILGPRQCGKTTLAKQFAQTIKKKEVHFFDLEDPNDLQRLENPSFAFEDLKGYIFIDEIQRKPELFPILRVLIDKKEKDTKFILVGSASRDILEKSSETLAGRIGYIELGGFNLSLLPEEDIKKLWLRGGFPRSFLTKDEASSFAWRKDFISTFLERDIPNLGVRIPPNTLRRFWTMLSHYHGQSFNASEIGTSFGIADTTARNYLDILVSTFLIRELQPWHYNTKKRLVKRPKIFFRDSGIFHSFANIKNLQELNTHPKLGASWEAFALEQCIEILNLQSNDIFFWSIHEQAELDLIFEQDGDLYGVEVKYSETPSLTKSMQIAFQELDLKEIIIIYPGTKSYMLREKVRVVSINSLKNLKI